MTTHDTDPRLQAAILVAVKPWMAPLAKRYLANRRREADQLPLAVAAGDWQLALTLGHNWKGAAAFGFVGITPIGAALERAAAEHDATSVVQAAADLLRYAERVQVVDA